MVIWSMIDKPGAGGVVVINLSYVQTYCIKKRPVQRVMQDSHMIIEYSRIVTTT